MHIPTEIMDRFFTGTRTDAVRFVYNDAVRVKAGPHAGRTGAVVSLLSLDPEATFLVEPGTRPYGDFEVPESALELLE